MQRKKPGPWQRWLLDQYKLYGWVWADARRYLEGAATKYLGRYQRSLDNLMARTGAQYVPGPRGGRWGGRYVRPSDPLTNPADGASVEAGGDRK